MSNRRRKRHTPEQINGTADEVVVDSETRSFSLEHTYLDDGESGASDHLYTVNVAVFDRFDVGQASTTITVNNAAPVVGPISGPTPGAGVPGQAVTFSISFTDAGTVDTHEVQWDFGDGTVIPFQPTTMAGALAPSHIYATTGTFPAGVTLRDDDLGTVSVTKEVTIQSAALQDDPLYDGKKMLVIGGTQADDTIVVNLGGSVNVLINGQSCGSFQATSRIVIFGQEGNDDIQVAGAIELAAWIYGGPGHDRIKGGGGHDLLFGELGDDLLLGGSGRDMMVGDGGKDRILGNAGDDIMIGGILSFADRDQALRAIMAEWISAREYETRLRNLSSGVDGYFLRLGETVTNDDDSDVLTGSSGLDWSFFDLDNDRATDLKDEAYANDLDWILAV